MKGAFDMGLKIKTGLLLCLMSAAVCSCLAAYRSMHFSSSAVPEEIYAQFMDGAPLAEYYLRDSGGHVAVFSSRRDKTPLTVTPIETACLRTADRAMLRGGIPVESEDELLMLLEDLGS